MTRAVDGTEFEVIGWDKPDTCKSCGRPTQDTFLVRIGDKRHRFALQPAFELCRDLHDAAYSGKNAAEYVKKR